MLVGLYRPKRPVRCLINLASGPLRRSRICSLRSLKRGDALGALDEALSAGASLEIQKTRLSCICVWPDRFAVQSQWRLSVAPMKDVEFCWGEGEPLRWSVLPRLASCPTGPPTDRWLVEAARRHSPRGGMSEQNRHPRKRKRHPLRHDATERHSHCRPCEGGCLFGNANSACGLSVAYG